MRSFVPPLAALVLLANNSGCFTVAGPVDPAAVAADLAQDGGRFPDEVAASPTLQTAISQQVISQTTVQLQAALADAGVPDFAAATARLDSLVSGLETAQTAIATLNASKLGLDGGTVAGDVAITQSLTIGQPGLSVACNFGSCAGAGFSATYALDSGGTVSAQYLYSTRGVFNVSFGLYCGTASRSAARTYSALRNACIDACPTLGQKWAHVCTQDEVAHSVVAQMFPASLSGSYLIESVAADCSAFSSSASTGGTAVTFVNGVPTAIGASTCDAASTSALCCD